MTNAIPDNKATIQKDITGTPRIIIKPTKNRTSAAKPLQARELNMFLIFEIKTTDDILSMRKKTPIRAINQSRLILGTNSKSTPIVKIYLPKKTE